jgi:energy-coupling factor transporter ATP-binding protein EcfA2
MATAGFKTIRVFISSTFRDMQAERDYVVRFVFPRLREDLLARRIHLIDVDLRWGVTGDQNALDVCREVIDECRPRFLCLLGGRYGWVPPGETFSITADEVRYGVLDRSLTERGYAFFYFRDPSVTESMGERELGEYREPAGSVAAAALAELKSSISAAGYEPFLYSGKWSEETRRLVRLERLGARVYADLMQSIAAEFPETTTGNVDEIAEQDAAVEAFMEEQLSGFVLGTRERIASQLVAHMIGPHAASYACLIGESGSGKSALLAFVVNVLRQSSNAPIVISQFVGVGERSTQVEQTQRFFCGKLGVPVASIPPGEQLEEALRNSLKAASLQRRVVIVLDAVNQLDRSGTAPPLHWLQRVLPANARVLLSTTPDETIAEIRNQLSNVQEVRLPTLEPPDADTIVSSFLTRYAKSLAEEQRAELLAKPSAVLPLYLRAALEELRTLGYYEEITQRIRELPSDTVRLFEWMFQRLEGDDGFADSSVGAAGQQLVETTASLLCVSRDGLSEDELLALTGDTRGNLAALLLLLRPYLMFRGRLLDFYHDQLRRAAMSLYANTTAKVAVAHTILARYFLGEISNLGGHQNQHAACELIYHMRSAGMWGEVISCLNNRSTFERLPPASYGIGYHAGTFVAADPGGVSPAALFDLQPTERSRIACALAESFASAAQRQLDQAHSFEKPWQLTAHRLRQTDLDAFAAYRDTFYSLVYLADQAFGYAVVAFRDSPRNGRDRAGQFLRDWARVAHNFQNLIRRGSAQTGLSHAIEDLVSEESLQELMTLGGIAAPIAPSTTAERDVPSQRSPTDREESWLAAARPTLLKIADRFHSMEWHENEPPPDGVSFENDVKSLVAGLPPFTGPTDLSLMRAVLSKYLEATIRHGVPIPDDYHLSVILPEPGSTWKGPARVAFCLRPGLFVTSYEREGCGGLTPGVLVEPQVTFE